MPLALLVCAVLTTLAPPQSPALAAPDLRNLRWVRGVVSASSPDSLTLTLKDRVLTIGVDPATETVGSPLAVGSLVEAHYVDRHGVRRAIVLLSGIEPGDLSKRAKRSLRGTVMRMKRSTLTVRAGGKTRKLSLTKRARLLDRDGRTIGTGSAEIGKLLSGSADVLVKYDGDAGMLIGDTMVAGNDNAVEIRRLR